MIVGMFKESFTEAMDDCVHTEFKVPLRDGNDFQVPVLVHTPKFLIECHPNAALIYAHGGGVVAGDAAMMKGRLSDIGKECGVVCFNVDYRLWNFIILFAHILC